MQHSFRLLASMQNQTLQRAVRAVISSDGPCVCVTDAGHAAELAVAKCDARAGAGLHCQTRPVAALDQCKQAATRSVAVSPNRPLRVLPGTDAVETGLKRPDVQRLT